jgi:CheY-like chemotaxis protein
VNLPAATAVVEAPVTPRVPEGTPPRGLGQRILLVEDDAGVQSLAAAVLRRAGYDVLTACNAGEALAIAERSPVDLVLTDVVLPGASGFTLVDRLEAAGRLPAVLFISGYSAEALARRGELGRWRHLDKPFTLERLLGEVWAALAEGGQRATREAPTPGRP